MELIIAPRDILQIDDARIIWPNFEGRPDEFTREGDRGFDLIIPNQDIADRLMNNKNKFGVGWNVKIKAPRTPDESPFIHMKVKVKFNDRGPVVILHSGNVKRQLNEDTIGMLDKIDIDRIDMDIRPYDGEGRFGPHRTAYLQGMAVYQKLDRFAAQMAEEEYPGEEPWN